uniref:Putative homing endonuclease n=1 Tax=viral metagenome TaxID=1070528 RepID=A0A6M3XWP1_9ZZZZ
MRPEAKALYPTNWREIRDRIKFLRNYTCEGCGQVGSRVRNPLTVHHIDYNPRNNLDANLLLLCAKCHLRLQQGVYPSEIAKKLGQLPLPLEVVVYVALSQELTTMPARSGEGKARASLARCDRYALPGT